MKNDAPPRQANALPPNQTTAQQPPHKTDQNPPAEGFANGHAHAFAIRANAFAAVPIFDTHERAKNFAAIIEEDPTAPAGLARQFLPLLRGPYYYNAEDLRTGDALEFAADRRSARGQTTRRRIYAAVSAIRTDAEGKGEALLCFFDTARDAIAHARCLRRRPPNDTPAQQGADLARQFADTFAARVEEVAATVEGFDTEETPDAFAARILKTAANGLPFAPVFARAGKILS